MSSPPPPPHPNLPNLQTVSLPLVTTFIGLVLAIPAMMFHGILKNRIQRLVLEIGMVSEGLMGRFATVGKGKQG